MKRLRSSEDLESYGEKGVFKDWARREEDVSLHRSSSNRSFYYKSESGRKGPSSSLSSRFEDDRESTRPIKKRADYDVDNYDRRKSYDRYNTNNDRGVLSSSPRGGYCADRIHRSESFSGPRRDFPKGFRSERDRSRREGSVSSWRRFGGGKDDDEGTRSGGDSARGSRIESEDNGKATKSPPGWRDARSPAWSKDSGSEQSRSVEVKKSEGGSEQSRSVEIKKNDGASEQSRGFEAKENEGLPKESSGNSSEMEEGELEPEPEPEQEPDHPSSETEPVAEDEPSGEMNLLPKEHDSEPHVESKTRDDRMNNSFSEQKFELSKVSGTAGQSEETQSDNVQGMSGDHGTSIRNGTETVVDRKNESTMKSSSSGEEKRNVDAEKLPPKKREQVEEKKSMDVESKVDRINISEFNKEPVASVAHADVTHSLKDKGKSVAVNMDTAPAYGMRIESETESRSIVPCDNGSFDMEGPSTRGLELFLSGPVKKPEKTEKFSNSKHRNDMFGTEPLELSLSLPSVLLPIGAQKDDQPAPGSPSQARSFQSLASSFRTNSDGFTMSMSFSGSQHFTHNPSCSLTHNSVDYEQSVKSRPLFQGVDWQALASNEQKNNDIPNGTGLYQQSQGNGQAVSNQLRAAPVVLDRQLSTGKASRHANGARSPTQSVGSRETGAEYNKDKAQLTRAKSSSFYRFGSSDGKQQLPLSMGPDFVESVITTMVSEPISVTAKRFNEISGQHLLCLKEAVCDIITNPSKNCQLSTLQTALQKRLDITLDTLLKCHRSQLELLVALKTGLGEFLRQSYDVSSSDLAEMFLNLRCRNLTCRSSLPVDECECRVCSQKNGFCSACMCLVCSKFDMASNTCSWVGCDVCLHWCHADCGLRESYIRNGRSAASGGAKGGSVEMQFHCVACNHPSEMFGFVKEVFQNFAKEWTAEALSKELEYVRRVFSASEDIRGKRLHDIANYMLSKLAIKADLQEVQSQIMHFFLTEPEPVKSANVPVIQGKELSTKNHRVNNGVVAGPSDGAMWLKTVNSEKAAQLEKATCLPSSFNKQATTHSSYQPGIEKGPVFDELESIVRIKQAEAKMFQARADEARREADALKRIAVTKNGRVEEEYIARITKLRLTEAEEMRKQKLDELQSLERAYQEYFGMKMRMENNIKDLLLKMEATRRNLSL